MAVSFGLFGVGRDRDIMVLYWGVLDRLPTASA